MSGTAEEREDEMRGGSDRDAPTAANRVPSLSDRVRAWKRERQLRAWRPGRVWDITQHRTWGNRISFWMQDKLGDTRVWGHTTPRPRADDELRVPMQSGRVGRYWFKKIEYELDPRDMWFADVEFVGYVDEAVAA